MSKHFMEPELKKNFDLIDKDKDEYSKYCIIDCNKSDTFEVYTMAGESIKPYEYYCSQIINYVHKWFKILLKTIVIDFVRDERGVIFFLGVKAFTPLYEECSIGKVITNKEYIHDEKNLNKIYKTLTCKMCFLNYPISKITKTITLKLIFKLKNNLEKRNYDLLSHIIVRCF